jgi:hypothetical protein
MNNCICLFSRMFLLGILILKVSLRDLYKSFGVKGLMFNFSWYAFVRSEFRPLRTTLFWVITNRCYAITQSSSVHMYPLGFRRLNDFSKTHQAEHHAIGVFPFFVTSLVEGKMTCSWRHLDAHNQTLCSAMIPVYHCRWSLYALKLWTDGRQVLTVLFLFSVVNGKRNTSRSFTSSIL